MPDCSQLDFFHRRGTEDTEVRKEIYPPYP